MSKKIVKSVDKLTKEECEELLKLATPEELETYKSFGESWQMGLVMSGIWANHSDELFSFENDKGKNKKPVESKTKATEEDSDKPEIQQHSAYHPLNEIERKQKVLENPDFDFHNFYEIGQTLHIVKCYPSLNKYEVTPVKIRSIWDRFMIGTVESGYAECMDYAMRDMIHANKLEAEEHLQDLKEKYPAKKYEEYSATTGAVNNDEE